MASPIRTTSYTITGNGAVTPPIPFQATTFAGALPPTFLAFVTGTVTYNVEVTGDDINSPGYNPVTGNWMPFTNRTGLTASAPGTLGAVVKAVRAHITAGTGSLLFQFIQQTPD